MKKKISFENLSGILPRPSGLESDEVDRQLVRFGKNEIVERVGNPILDLIKETIKDPMIWFLFGIGVVFIFVGQKQEAFILFVAILPLAFMDAFLHWRTQVSTAALRGQLSTQALVLRGGQEVEIKSLDIVPGDLVVLSSKHAFLPADGMWELSESVQVDESMLTGEAFPISKRTLEMAPSLVAATGGEVLVETDSLGFAGTRLLTGRGLLRVLNTGRSTAYGEIVQSVSGVTHERTALQLAISNLVQILIYASGALCLILAFIRYHQGHGWLDALLSAATLAVAAIPEEFPVVFTFFLGVGVYRLAHRHALVRRAVSVENIGRINQICTDKTGTITIGQLRLTHVDAAPGVSESEALSCALSACDPTGTDPVDQAIQDFAKRFNLQSPSREHVFPFTEDRKRESAFLTIQGKNLCFSKGAPEVILARCQISDSERAAWILRTKKWAAEGHKVLACASRAISESEKKTLAEPEGGFNFAGLLAFEDPPRPEVREAMEYTQRNGIRVMMLTGDHPETALAIAKEVGLGGDSPRVISAEDSSAKFEESFVQHQAEFLHEVDVVARCNPMQKYRIVKALRGLGDLVAVTGDGVNDVPALKNADIGIAMGIRGTRSAKEVSSIVLADDNFSTIINAIREGRQLFSNLKSSFEYLLLFHLPFVLTAALIPLMGYPLLYLPVHVVWLELIIHPSALFAFQQSAMDTKEPRPIRQTAFFSKKETFKIVFIGLMVAVVVAMVYVSALDEKSEVGHARAKVMALLSMWSFGLVLVLTKARTTASKFLLLVTMLSAIFLIQTPQISGYLHLIPLDWSDWFQGFILVASFILFLKVIGRLLDFNDKNRKTSLDKGK